MGQYTQDMRNQSMLHNLTEEQRQRVEERKQREAGQDHVVLPPAPAGEAQPQNEDLDVFVQRHRAEAKSNACWYLVLFLLFGYRMLTKEN